MVTIDRKFVILAVNPCKPGTKFLVFVIRVLQWIARVFNLNANTERNAFLFKAADVYAVDALKGYNEAMKRGEKGTVDQWQLASGEKLQGRVANFQMEETIHVPGMETDCEIDRTIGGIGVK